MKKAILCSMVLLFVLGGMVATPFGVGMAEAGNCLLPSSEFVYGPDCFAKGVKAIITISKNHDIQIFNPTGKNFKKPKKQGGGDQTDPPGDPDTPDLGELPGDLEDDVFGSGGKYKLTTIIVSGNKTCVKFNGTYYCW